MRFSVSIDLTGFSDHAHTTAQHSLVRALLDDVKQQLGSGLARKGDLIYTAIVNGQSTKAVIGCWAFEET